MFFAIVLTVNFKFFHRYNKEATRLDNHIENDLGDDDILEDYIVIDISDEGFESNNKSIVKKLLEDNDYSYYKVSMHEDVMKVSMADEPMERTISDIISPKKDFPHKALDRERITQIHESRTSEEVWSITSKIPKILRQIHIKEGFLYKFSIVPKIWDLLLLLALNYFVVGVVFPGMAFKLGIGIPDEHGIPLIQLIQGVCMFLGVILYNFIQMADNF